MHQLPTSVCPLSICHPSVIHPVVIYQNLSKIKQDGPIVTVEHCVEVCDCEYHWV